MDYPLMCAYYQMTDDGKMYAGWYLIRDENEKQSFTISTPKKYNWDCRKLTVDELIDKGYDRDLYNKHEDSSRSFNANMTREEAIIMDEMRDLIIKNPKINSTQLSNKLVKDASLIRVCLRIMQNKFNHINIVEIGDGGRLLAIIIKDEGNVFFLSGRTYLEEFEKEELARKPMELKSITVKAGKIINSPINQDSSSLSTTEMKYITPKKPPMSMAKKIAIGVLIAVLGGLIVYAITELITMFV